MRKIRPPEERFWTQVAKNGPDDCWNWTGSVSGPGWKTGDGYGNLSLGPGLPVVKTHRYSYELANGPIPDGVWVLHSCDNKRCVNPKHLSLGDASRNGKEAYARGRRFPLHHPLGEANWRSKLTNEQVYFIKKELSLGIPVRALSRQTGIPRTTINHIRNGRTRPHITID